MIKKTIKIYAVLRLTSLFFMGIVYANQNHEEFTDDMTDHRHIMVAPNKRLYRRYKTKSTFSIYTF
jgi:hypothetical protein